MTLVDARHVYLRLTKILNICQVSTFVFEIVITHHSMLGCSLDSWRVCGSASLA